MSVIAIGDIHGNSEALEDLLAQVVPEMRPDDTLVFLGDYIDRGPDSKGCIEQILRLKVRAHFPVVTLMGNHEQWMLRSLSDSTQHSWLIAMDALETIKSYSEEAARPFRNRPSTNMVPGFSRSGFLFHIARSSMPCRRNTSNSSGN